MRILNRWAESSRMDASLVKCADDPIALAFRSSAVAVVFSFSAKSRSQRCRAAQQIVNLEQLALASSYLDQHAG
jgi:hypothetical protein